MIHVFTPRGVAKFPGYNSMKPKIGRFSRTDTKAPGVVTVQLIEEVQRIECFHCNKLLDPVYDYDLWAAGLITRHCLACSSDQYVICVNPSQMHQYADLVFNLEETEWHKWCKSQIRRRRFEDFDFDFDGSWLYRDSIRVSPHPRFVLDLGIP